LPSRGKTGLLNPTIVGDRLLVGSASGRVYSLGLEDGCQHRMFKADGGVRHTLNVKIRSVRHNNRKKVFEVDTSTKTLVFPFSKATPTPTTEDPITELSVDPEAGREAFTYVLHSGRCGTVHVEQVLEYNQTRPTSAISCCTD
jgi:hypothetical protein